MEKTTEIPSVHPYLNFAAKFIADMEPELVGKPDLLLRQKMALEFIGTAITMLLPSPMIKVPCMGGWPQSGGIR